MAERIVTQPPSGSMRIAYRPIILEYEVDNVYVPMDFAMTAFLGMALCLPLIPKPLLPGDTLNISDSILPASNGDHTVNTVNTILIGGITYQTISKTPGLFPWGNYGTSVKLAINGDTIVKRVTPTVVYCDIYVEGVYYKTLTNTQYIFIEPGEEDNPLNPGYTRWRFDLQDVAQEILGECISHGAPNIEEHPKTTKEIAVKFRYGTVNVEGFIESNVLAPIQGTSSSDPVAGDGEESNSFDVVNSSIQAPGFTADLGEFLDSLKTGAWGYDTYPLSKWMKPMEIGVNDRDHYPILSRVRPTCITLKYKPKGSISYEDLTVCECTGVYVSTPISVPTTHDYYSTFGYSFLLQGTPTFNYSIESGSIPAWLNISIDLTMYGWMFNMYGTPDSLDPVVAIIKIINGCGEIYFDINLTITCEEISLAPYSFDDAAVDAPYEVIIPILAGMTLISLNVISIPTWMTVAINVPGEYISFTGTPVSGDEGIDIPIQVELINGCGSVMIDELINVDDGLGIGFFVTLSKSSGNLNALIMGGVPPYTYEFFIVDLGSACAAHTMGAATGGSPTDGIVSTSYTVAQYAGANYQFYAVAYDSTLAMATSNTLTEFACLVPDTWIEYPNDTRKQLRDVQVGDILASNNKVTGKSYHVVNPALKINDGLLIMSLSHVNIMFNGQKKQGIELKEGDLLINEFANPVMINKIELVYEDTEVINISTENKTYIANGILTHNKLSC